MLFKSYNEFYSELTTLLDGWDVVLGTSKDELDRETCFITHRGSVVTTADDTPFISSTTYDLVFLQRRAAFTNVKVIALTESGVRFTAYDEDTGMNIFTGSVTLFGPWSVPDE